MTPPTKTKNRMNQNEYLDTLLDGSGHLNTFPNKINDKSPDYGGFIKLDGKIYRLSAWIKNSNATKIAVKAMDLEEYKQKIK